MTRIATMDTRLEASYRHCDTVAKRQARNFYYGFRLLPRPRRLALSAMYAFFRACDDIADGPGTVEEKDAALRSWRSTMDAALGDDPDEALRSSEVFPAFRDAVKRYAIPAKCFHDLLDGARMDLDTFTYETFDDLYRYCYRVASTVGLVCVHVFGFDGADDSLKMAEWCGIGFQLTNIMRDIEEDATLGRIYLPQEDLRGFGVSSDDLRRGVCDERFVSLMRFQAERAREFYARSAGLTARLSPESRGAFEAMVGIYRGLLEKIVREEFRVFGRRVSLSKSHKIGLLLKAFLKRHR